MERRRFLGMMGAGAVGLSLPRLRLRAQPQPDGQNVVLIILEDLNDWVGCLRGHPDTITPNLDAFAASGVLFSNAHAAAPMCNPSRTAFLTGLHPTTTGCYTNSDDWRGMLPPGHPTLPRWFQEAGHYNLRAGKIYHPSFQRLDHWDEYLRIPRLQSMMNGVDPYTPYHPHNGLNTPICESQDFLWGPTDAPLTSTHDYKVFTYSATRIGMGIDEPFFFGIGTHNSHYPWIVPREYFERFNLDDIHLPDVLDNDLDDIPPAGLAFVQRYFFENTISHKSWRKAVQAYLATINHLDEMLGRFLNEFDALPIADQTTVVVVADHGHHVGEKKHMRKWTLWEESTLSYLAIRSPGVTQPGGVCSEAVGLIDLYPTIADLCQLPSIPTVLDGISLLPQLLDPSATRDQPVLTTNEEGNHAVRDERWRYIRYADSSEELYDHDADPNEWTNLAGDPAYEAIKAELAQWMPPPGWRHGDESWSYRRKFHAR